MLIFHQTEKPKQTKQNHLVINLVNIINMGINDKFEFI